MNYKAEYEKWIKNEYFDKSIKDTLKEEFKKRALPLLYEKGVK